MKLTVKRKVSKFNTLQKTLVFWHVATMLLHLIENIFSCQSVIRIQLDDLKLWEEFLTGSLKYHLSFFLLWWKQKMSQIRNLLSIVCQVLIDLVTCWHLMFCKLLGFLLNEQWDCDVIYWHIHTWAMKGTRLFGTPKGSSPIMPDEWAPTGLK